MNSQIPKQYLEIDEKPIIYYTIKAFSKKCIDEIILVTGKDDIEYVKKDIVDKYNLQKVTKIVAGGANRYDSVYEGLKAIEIEYNKKDTPKKQQIYVHIHDGARPCITEEEITNITNSVEQYKACALGVKVKDTIKIVNANQNVIQTPNRETLWAIHTPQSFEYSTILSAYTKMYESMNLATTKDTATLENQQQLNITDDAMVLEHFSTQQLKLIQGNYTNIKITTPEDLQIAKIYLQNINN